MVNVFRLNGKGPAMEIEILEIRPIRNGPLKGFVDVRVGDLTLYEFRIFQRDGQRLQVQAPLATWRDKQGVIRYRCLFSAPAELMQRIELAVLSGWEMELKSGKSASHTGQ